MHLLKCSANVLRNISQEHRGVESLVFVGYSPVSGSNLTLAACSGGCLGVEFAPDFCVVVPVGQHSWCEKSVHSLDRRWIPTSIRHLRPRRIETQRQSKAPASRGG